jgi:hypothetical protein
MYKVGMDSRGNGVLKNFQDASPLRSEFINWNDTSLEVIILMKRKHSETSIYVLCCDDNRQLYGIERYGACVMK